MKKNYSTPKVTSDREFASNIVPAAAVAAGAAAVAAFVTAAAPALAQKAESRTSKGSGRDMTAFIPSLRPVEVIG